MESQRCAVVELHRVGKSASEILKALKLPKSRLSFVYRTIQRYNETGSENDRNRSSHPRTATTPKVNKTIASRIARNPQRSMKKMAGKLQISRKSVRHVVKRDSGLSFLKLRNVHSFMAASRQKQLERSHSLIQRFAAHKKIFTVEQSFNHQNDRILTCSVSTFLKISETSAKLKTLRPSWSGWECPQKGKLYWFLCPKDAKLMPKLIKNTFWSQL